MNSKWLVVGSAIFIFIAAVIAYQPVMFNFFNADDFHFMWLFEATKHDPSLLWPQISQAIGPYYRPMMNIVMFPQYLLFGPNALCFRVVGLTLKFITALVIAFLVIELAKKSNDQALNTSKKTWAILTAGLFTVYPIHTEAIDWVMCQVDLMANLFMLLTLWCYIRWSSTQNVIQRNSSYFFQCCAFLTKEATVVMPAIIFMYDLLIHRLSADGIKNRNILEIFLKALKNSAVSWLILVLYFCLRLLVVGSFIGTWKDGGFYNPDISMIIKGWTLSIRAIFIPISAAMFDHAYLVYIGWTLSLVLLLLLTISTIGKNNKLIFLVLFLISWFVLCLIPMYKMLYITPELFNARYGYIVSVPVCAFLTLGLARNNYLKSMKLLRNTLIIILLCFSTFILRNNNLAWAEAGRLTNNLVIGIRLANRDSTRRTYLVNIPDVFKGVPINGMDSAQAINRKPFAERDLYNCTWLCNHNTNNDQSLTIGDQSLPIGLLKDILASDKNQALFFIWNNHDQCLHRINLNKYKNALSQYDLLAPNLVLTKRNSIFTYEPEKLDSWPFDALICEINLSNRLGINKNAVAQLDYTNDYKSGMDFSDALVLPLKSDQAKQTLIFPVRGIPIWEFGGRCHTIRLKFPRDYNVQIERAYLARIENLMPKIIIAKGNYANNFGTLELNAQCPELVLNYDVRHINNCAGVLLEVVSAGENFKQLNTANSTTKSLISFTSIKTNGQIKLEREMFENSGQYRIRLRPIDQQGNQIGLCSDHFNLAVTK